MKIQPKKTAAVPKYAAIMAAAVMLTGCGYDDEAVLVGDIQPIDSQVQIDGDMQVCPEDQISAEEDAEQIAADLLGGAETETEVHSDEN